VSEPTNPHIVVITGAAALSADARRAARAGSLIVAADGGLDVAFDAELRPDLLVGDLDSITANGLAWAEDHIEIERHPADKDATDTELALRAAIQLAPRRITLLGGGDRLDHTIAAIGALGAPALAAIDRLDAWWDDQHLEVLHGPRSLALQLEPDSTLSLLALGGPCTGVCIEGTRWTLEDTELPPGNGRGVSNLARSPTVHVAVGSGVLTVFDHPAPPTPDQEPHAS
jgi:thiamine pyrophosphokinase